MGLIAHLKGGIEPSDVLLSSVSMEIDSRSTLGVPFLFHIEADFRFPLDIQGV
jgi:hypothetical protein